MPWQVDFFMGMVVGVYIVVIVSTAYDAHYRTDAFERGYMVECIGKTGYYWKGECDE